MERLYSVKVGYRYTHSDNSICSKLLSAVNSLDTYGFPSSTFKMTANHIYLNFDHKMSPHVHRKF